MKRLIVVMTVMVLSSACLHPWVGRPVAQLEKEFGPPLNIQRTGDSRVYYYPDTLAGRGQMSFTVDKNGIIRSWCASSDVPGVFGDDPFGVGFSGTGTAVEPNTGTSNDPVLRQPVSLGTARTTPGTILGTGGRGGLAPACR